MKVLFISDFGIKHNIGGAQRSNQLIIDEGIKRGHEITQYFYDSQEELLHDDYDITVTSNMEVISRVRPWIFNYLMERKYIRLEHDMNRYLDTNTRKQLFVNSKLNVFLSEYHYDCFRNAYGNHFDNHTIIYDPIGAEFNNNSKPSTDAILYVGYMHELKGTNLFFEYVLERPEQTFHMYSWADNQQYIKTAFSFPNIVFNDPVNYHEMPYIYNNYNKMYYTPQMHEPFCRSVAEALICGVEIIGNSKIGCLNELKGPLSNNLDLFTERCLNASNTFWEQVECL